MLVAIVLSFVVRFALGGWVTGVFVQNSGFEWFLVCQILSSLWARAINTLVQLSLEIMCWSKWWSGWDVLRIEKSFSSEPVDHFIET